MKEFLKNLIASLFIMFTICLIIFACVNTENGNFSVLPICFVILFFILAIIKTIAKYNNKKAEEEKAKNERLKKIRKIEEKERKERASRMDSYKSWCSIKKVLRRPSATTNNNGSPKEESYRNFISEVAKYLS